MHIEFWRGKPRRKFEDDMNMDLKDIRWSVMDWIDLPHNRDQWTALVDTVMNLRVPLNVVNFSSSCLTGGFSRRARSTELS
jgi:hypothetical protein